MILYNILHAHCTIECLMGTESTDVTACPDYFGAAQQWLEPTIMI